MLLVFLLLSLLPLPASAAPPKAPSGAPAAAELPLGCFETILNGGFEQLNIAWTIPQSNYPGVYDNTLAFEGAFSMLLGRVSGPVYAAESSVIQSVDLPSNSTSVILNFRYYGRIEGTVSTADRQYLDLYDANTNSFIRRQFEARNGDALWLGAQYDLTNLRGRSIRFVFGTSNDGGDGRIAMNIDQVSVYYCSPQATATPTPTPTLTPTLWPTWFPSPTPTWFPTWTPPTPTFQPPPLTPGGCMDIIVNGGFEGDGGWEFGKTPIQGGVVGAPVYAGARAAQLGNPPGFCPDTVAFSSVRQLVTIPPNATFAQLTYFAQYGTQEAPSNSIAAGQDRQELILLNPDLTTLAVISRQRTTTGGYVQQSADLSAYRGRSVYIYFNALNDGNNLTTWMYLDNVSLCTGGAVPQPFTAQGAATAAAPGAWIASPPAPTAAPTVPPAQNFSTPVPTFFVPTITATPTGFPNPAPLGASSDGAPPQEPPAQQAAPQEQPAAQSTPDLAAQATLQQYALDMANGTPQAALQEAALQEAALQATPSNGDGTTQTVAGRTYSTLTGMCAVVIVAVLIFGGILYVVSRPKKPPTGGPPTTV